MISELQLISLAEKIKNHLKDEFEELHLSGNLMDTITIDHDGDGYLVKIPAKVYDILQFYKTGAIIYREDKGSYAQEVNITGGFSGRHKGYVEKSINNAINEWIAENSFLCEVERI